MTDQRATKSGMQKATDRFVIAIFLLEKQVRRCDPILLKEDYNKDKVPFVFECVQKRVCKANNGSSLEKHPDLISWPLARVACRSYFH